MAGRFRDLTDLRAGYTTDDDHPIPNFYTPVLRRAVSLDRKVGYFTSSGLTRYAPGLVGLINNGGKMRLLVGAQLQPDDIRAIENGTEMAELARRRLLEHFTAPQSEIETRRLEILAWMVSAGTLEIKVSLPRNQETNLPIPAPQADAYFHAKSAVATDSEGDRIGWSGSNNDTVAAHEKNFEEFSVYASWIDGTRHIDLYEERFTKLWGNQHPGWITIPVPEAVEKRLLEYTPPQAPATDPDDDSERAAPAKEAVIAAWLRDAPHLVGVGRRLGRATANIVPWPHQHRVAEDIVAGFPDRFLLADEVGLGKTIEVGLALRDLILSGVVERCLILAPRSVLKQWEGELREKFLLETTEYTGPASLAEGSLVLASSQLAKRLVRREELLAGPDWDLIVVDEAHHARRKDFKDRRRRPNRLLELLEGVNDLPGLASKTRGLLLLTATPMQVHPLEVWDLIFQLGLPGCWGASGDHFVRYFEALRRAGEDWTEADWDLVAALAGDEWEHGGEPYPEVAEPIRNELGWAPWSKLAGLISARNGHGLRKLSSPQRASALALLRHLTPLRRRMRRSTRRTLHEYQNLGLLPDRLAERLPEPRWITMEPDEQRLYDRIEDYISNFYRKYEDERKGLGFVMTVYRRRLTSSFHALQRSLERRLDFLEGTRDQLGLTDADLEEDDLFDDRAENLEATSEPVRSIYTEEIQFVEDFLRDLRLLGSDTKFSRLLEDLEQALSRRESVVIFTQYFDTMEYLRDQLGQVYGRRMACYSGRGGERLHDGHWEEVGKERIKQDFATGEIAILLGTDAMAEGLNLQTCGVEINYDVPWNPMRLEQRIGRVDRIGQTFDQVWIWSYFLEGTIEAEVYRRLMDRIDWFTGVVGPVQPILHQVGEAVKELALTSRQDRNTALDRKLAEIEEEIERAEREGFDFDAHLIGSDAPPVWETPVSGRALEGFLTDSISVGHRFRPDPDHPDSYLIDGQRVTFLREVSDQYPESVRLLTFGDPLFSDLLGQFPAEDPIQFGIARIEAAELSPRQVGWYHSQSDPAPTAINTLSDLERAIDHGSRSHPTLHAEAEQAFQAVLRQQLHRQAQADQSRQAERRSARHETGALLLKQTTYAWLARHNLYEADDLPMTDQSVTLMIQALGYPFGPLRQLIRVDFRLTSTDPEWRDVRNRNQASLDSRIHHLRRQAQTLIHTLAESPCRPTLD
ncbi:MAG: helicase-related protein [bacterium]|nr:helicase-related protein [bacterium]